MSGDFDQSIGARMRAANSSASSGSGDEALRQELLFQALFGSPEPLRIGRFVLEERLGAGAMGSVFAARDERLERRVAIKILRAETLHEAARERLIREARGQAQVAHPNVVGIFEVDEADGQPFIVMEYVDGVRLDVWQVGRRWKEVLQAYLQAARGLHTVHSRGLVHRDFKAANVLVTVEGLAKVADFGLVGTGAEPPAQPLSESSDANLRLTQTGALVGTPAFMAPEQFVGGQGDAQTDQFSFCVALWEALYGTRPFAGTTIVDLMAAMGEPPARGRADSPRALRGILMRGLAVRPARRYESVQALADALEPLLHRKRRNWIAGIVLALVIVAVLLFGLNRSDQRQAEQAATDDVARLRELLTEKPEQVVAEVAQNLESNPELLGLAHQALRTPVPTTLAKLDSSVIHMWPRDDGSMMVRESGAGFHVVDDAGSRPVEFGVFRTAEAQRHVAVATDRTGFGMQADFVGGAVAVLDNGDRLLVKQGEVWRYPKDGSRRVNVGAAPETQGTYVAVTHAGDAIYFRTPEGRVGYRPFKVHAGPTWFSEISKADAPRVVPDGVLVGTELGGLFKLRDGAVVFRREDFPGAVGLPAGSPDGNWIATVVADRLRILRPDGKYPDIEWPFAAATVPHPIIDLQNRFVLSTDLSGDIRLTELPAGRTFTLPMATGTPSTTGFDLAGNVIAGYPDGRVQRWDLTSEIGEPVHRHAGGLWSAALSPDGQSLALPGRDGEIGLIATVGAPNLKRLAGTGRLYNARFNSDGTLLATGSSDGTARLWDLETRRGKFVFDGHEGWAYALAFSPDDRWLATASKTAVIRLHSTETGSTAILGNHGRITPLRVHTVAFTADGRFLVSASKSGTVIRWSVDNPGQKLDLPHHLVLPEVLRAGHRLLTRDRGPVIRVWSADASSVVRELKHRAAGTIGVVSSPSGRLVGACGTDNDIMIWDLDSDAAPRVVKGLLTPAEFFAFNADDTRLVAGQPGGRMCFWNLKSASEEVDAVCVLGHQGPVRFIGFAPDGSVLSASSDGDVRRWPWPNSISDWQSALRARIESP